MKLKEWLFSGTKQNYHEIPKISPGAYSNALFEGLIFGGAYLRKEICVSKSIGLALQLEVNLPFLLCFTLYLTAIFQVRGAYIWRGNLTEGFLHYRFEGLIHGGDYFRNFTVFYFMKFSFMLQVRRVHKTVLPGLSLIFRAAVANKDSPVTSPQNLVSPLASYFDHP